MSDWLKFAALLSNTTLWALVIPLRWPVFAAHFAGDWSDIEADWEAGVSDE